MKTSQIPRQSTCYTSGPRTEYFSASANRRECEITHCNSSSIQTRQMSSSVCELSPNRSAHGKYDLVLASDLKIVFPSRMTGFRKGPINVILCEFLAVHVVPYLIAISRDGHLADTLNYCIKMQSTHNVIPFCPHQIYRTNFNSR